MGRTRRRRLRQRQEAGACAPFVSSRFLHVPVLSPNSFSERDSMLTFYDAKSPRDFPGGPVVNSMLPMQGPHLGPIPSQGTKIPTWPN